MSSSGAARGRGADGAADASPPRTRILNINVGVLGHVDSGKTSLVAALSTKLSTAALDKHPQSKERGITLDLGFSSFSVPLPPHLSHLPYDELQFTLVDCPGHASLIRTIIGGVQIIDMITLVIDITKGLQTQTAECLVIGEVATSRLVVVLNKVDLLPEQDRPRLIRKAAKRLANTFNMTKFAGVTMVPVAARPGGGGVTPGEAAPAAQGLELLQSALLALVPPEPRPPSAGPLLFAVDHCFAIRGQGTVLTGTVLQGSVKVGDMVELPLLKMTRQVKSMQMFKQPVSKASKGDRLGLAVTQLDPAAVERGLVCAPGSVPTFSTAIAAVDKIRFFNGKVASKSKLHVSVGHTTVMAEVTFWGLPEGAGFAVEAAVAQMAQRLNSMALGDATTFDSSQEYLYQDELYGLEGRPCRVGVAGTERANASPAQHYGPQWALLRFETPVTAPRDSLVIGARFDADVHGEACRLALYGRLVQLIDTTDPTALPALRVFKAKIKTGVIERLLPEQGAAIVRGLFKKETDPRVYIGLKVTTGLGEEGVIESPFGKSGKLKVVFPASGITQVTGRSPADNAVTLACKRYVFDPPGQRRLRQ